MSRLTRLISDEIGQTHLRLFFANFLLSFLPDYTANRTRTLILRLAGFRIGKGTTFWGKPQISGVKGLYERLVIGEGCGINGQCVFDLGEKISIGYRVHIGAQAMLLTTSHELGPSSQRAGSLTRAPITIGDGAWLGSRTLVLPGVMIGAGAVVAAGSVVNKDVAPNTLVGGVPAKFIRQLSEDSQLQHEKFEMVD